MTSVHATSSGPVPPAPPIPPVAIERPNRAFTIFKNAAIFGGIGAAAGFGVSFLTLPVIGQVAAPLAAAIGGALGLGIGIIKGIRNANSQEAAYQSAVGLSSLAPPPA